MSTLRPAWLLATALLWRARRELGWKILLLPAAFGLFLVGFMMLAAYVPSLLTGPTSNALEQVGAAYFGGESGPALGMAAVLFQGPPLIALAASMTAASIAQNTVGSDAARGSLEVLASGPYSQRGFFGGLLGSIAGLTLTAWVLLALGSLGAASLGLALLDVPVDLPGRYWLFALAVPGPLALCSAALGLYLNLAVGSLAQMRAGTMNLGMTIVTLPAVALLVFVNLRPDVPSVAILATVVIAALVVTGLCLFAIGRRLSDETVLGS